MPHDMEPQEVREVALRFAWTWYRLERLIDRSLAEGGASLARIRLLAFLNKGSARLTDIASFFGHAPRTVTQAVDWLETNGHVIRTALPGDRRAKLVEITDLGRSMLRTAEPLFHRIIAGTFGALDQGEIARLASLLSRLNALVDKLEMPTGPDAPAAGDEARGEG